ncbi:hypothetical protein M9458_025783, partial [Cirrhinus mrigala]
SSSLTTLNGGAAKVYAEVPPVEWSVAMQLCPNTTSTWWGKPYLTGLTASAYAACGEAASALHAMTLLQVHQAKALKDLYEGGHDLEVLKELRTATDLTLRATKVTMSSLGHAMSNLVVQECHLWLCLADMMDADKVRFLNAPVSPHSDGECTTPFPRRMAGCRIFCFVLSPSASGSTVPKTSTEEQFPLSLAPKRAWRVVDGPNLDHTYPPLSSAIEPIPRADMKTGFYSPYFILPKNSGGLRTILDLRVLNWALHRLPFKRLMQKRIFGCIHPKDWFTVIDLKD